MNRNKVVMIAMTACFLGLPVRATEPRHSARSDSWADPFLAYGHNPKNKETSGYLVALRSAPGKTDECKLVFGRSSKSLEVKYREIVLGSANENRRSHGASIRVDEKGLYLIFSKKSLEGECRWILPFNIGENVYETADEIAVSMVVSNTGTWTGVYCISAKRASLHSQPNSSSVQKAYLVEGDVVYVYDERPNWYFVEYMNGKKKATGWMKKKDTFQL